MRSLFPSRRAVMLAGAAFAVLASGGAAQTNDISGRYLAEGRNPDGSAYSGRATLRQQGDTVQIDWTVGTAAFAGQGIRQGRVVTLDWGQEAPIIYVIMPDGSLHGTWSNGHALERLTRQ